MSICRTPHSPALTSSGQRSYSKHSSSKCFTRTHMAISCMRKLLTAQLTKEFMTRWRLKLTSKAAHRSSSQSYSVTSRSQSCSMTSRAAARHPIQPLWVCISNRLSKERRPLSCLA